MNQANDNPTPYDLAGRVIGCAMKVHSTLGAGFLESVYQNALAHELRKTGFHVETEVRLNVFYDAIVIGTFDADMIVDKSLIVENKAVSKLNPAHEVQLVNYLTATRIDEGLLLNFGGDSLEFKKKYRKHPHQ
ncbi:GxxExxY protein [Opitutaceae bacterium TAV4]|nr:GxxExxY protein [Opitutaceae bacterium TAV4]RRK00048.1 GxxExxY protein [Opitutaceae bacterium TAV3]